MWAFFSAVALSFPRLLRAAYPSTFPAGIAGTHFNMDAGKGDYITRQRAREIGIRRALGAARGQIFHLLLRQGLRLALVGLAVGITLSLALTLLKSQLFGVSTSDTVTFAAVTLILCAVAMAACYIPARRATKTDPNVALRYQ
jgi:ABC-type antimicrobial peptide transport system permease subunit